MPKCSECKYRRKIKELNGGLMTKGSRKCGKSGMPLVKHLYRNPVTDQILASYPIGCSGNGIPV